MNKTCQYKAIL